MIIDWHYHMASSYNSYYGVGFVFNWSGILGAESAIVNLPVYMTAGSIYVPGIHAGEIVSGQ